MCHGHPWMNPCHVARMPANPAVGLAPADAGIIMLFLTPVNPMARKPLPAKTPSKQAIFRAVASSTAIETGKPVRMLEKMLRDGPSGDKTTRLRSLVLAK